MKDKIKDIVIKQWKNLLLVLVYIVVASFVYAVWFNSLWHLWYVNLITVFVIAASGCAIGYFFIKGELNKQAKKEEKPVEEVKDNNAEVAEESK